ncbi:MAG: NAD(P)-binding domain-containing protein [Spirochaetia bacterium]
MHHEVIIVGAGPIGLEIGAALERVGRDYIILERGQLAQTIVDWPPMSRFFSSPERMAIAGVPFHTLHQQLAPKEEYLAYLRTVAEVFDLRLHLYETVHRAERRPQGGFSIESAGTYAPDATRSYTCDHLVLATGDMAAPNRLGIPGEDLPHVSHFFEDPHRYFRQRLLVVGGRNSAVEAAIRAWRAGAEVAVSYRRASFDSERLYSRHHLEITLLAGKGRIETHLQTVPAAIVPGGATLAEVDEELRPTGAVREIEADFVFLATGYREDYSLLHELGARFDGTPALPVLDDGSMETSVPGLYVAGTAIGHKRDGYTTFVGTSHDHARKIVSRITGDLAPEEIVSGTVPRRYYPFTSKDIQPE